MKYVAFLVVVMILSGCDFPTQYGYKEIELQTTTGETVTLSCPVYDGQPLGAHGRECYILVDGEE